MSKETILTQDCELSLNAFRVLAPVHVIKFHTVYALSSLGLTSVADHFSIVIRFAGVS
jgi:hypothetical protein